MDAKNTPREAAIWTNSTIFQQYRIERLIDLGWTFSWNGEFNCAIQDQVVKTENYWKFIIKDGTTDDVCRRSNSAVVSIQDLYPGARP